jgi:hypothetical protein cdiviTM7_02345
MRVVIVTKDDAEYSRTVSTFVCDFARQTGHSLETVNPESLDGESFCRAYDVVEYPTIIAISDDGHMQNMWRGLPLPTVSEVSFYV